MSAAGRSVVGVGPLRAAPASVGALTRVWALFLVLFECAALVQVLVLRKSVPEVQAMYAIAPSAAPDASHFCLLVAILAAVRAAAAAHPRSAGAWGAAALVHVVEAAFYVALLAPALLAAPPRLDASDARLRGAAVLAVVAANAAIFTRAWAQRRGGAAKSAAKTE